MLKLPLYKYVFLISDISTVFLSFIVTEIIFLQFHNAVTLTSSDLVSFLIISIILSLIAAFIIQYNNLYKLNVFLTLVHHFACLLKSILSLTVILIVISFLVKNSLFHGSRLFILIFILASIFLFGIIRVGLLRKLYLWFGKKWLTKNVLIVGAGKSASLIAAKLLLEEKIGLNIIGFLDDQKEIGYKITSKISVLGKISEIDKVSSSIKIDEVIIAIENITNEKLFEIIEFFRSKSFSVKIFSELFQIVSSKLVMENYSDLPIVDASLRINKKTIWFKYIVDKILAFFVLIIFSPLLLFISILIKLTSKGPILYKQQRIGYQGQLFMFYKFRSMEVRNEDDEERKAMMLDFMKSNKNNNNGHTKIVNENSVTWIGKILRKTSLDELPQLINILKGEMSLVGPRPCLPYEYEHYDAWQKRRVSVTPGCTGVWQVFGRSNVSFTDSVILDLYYINNMSLWLDLQLIIKTVPVMLFGRGGR